MPTFETDLTSWPAWYAKLTPHEKKAFKKTVGEKFVPDLKAGKFRSGLRVKGVQKMPGCFEMTWAPDGRAIFTYGPEKIKGEKHVVWLAVGGHNILP